MAALGGGAVSYERGTPVHRLQPLGLRCRLAGIPLFTRLLVFKSMSLKYNPGTPADASRDLARLLEEAARFETVLTFGNRAYMGTSLIRNSPPPYGRQRALGIFLL